jgi:hypothetical protein
LHGCQSLTGFGSAKRKILQGSFANDLQTFRRNERRPFPGPDHPYRETAGNELRHVIERFDIDSVLRVVLFPSKLRVPEAIAFRCEIRFFYAAISW